jgi:hypothetical protein
MKSIAVFLAVMILAAGMAWADEEFCPARRAAKLGHSPFDKFHEILAPVWHKAWPEKDYDALLSAATEFETAFEDVEKHEPTFETEARKTRFENRSKALGEVIKQYAEAAGKGDKEAVYEMMPSLHDAFELAASSLLPVKYPELEGMQITTGVVIKQHIPENNTEGIIGSTETLITQVAALTEESVPDDLVYFKEDLLKRFAGLKDEVSKMKECCDNNDMDGYKEHALALKVLIDDIASTYL